MICNYLKRLDSGFRRNDGEGGCRTFYEFIKVEKLVKSPKTRHCERSEAISYRLGACIY